PPPLRPNSHNATPTAAMTSPMMNRFFPNESTRPPPRRAGLLFPRREFLFQFLDLRGDHDGTVALVRMFAEVVLMVPFRGPEFLQRHDFGRDRIPERLCSGCARFLGRGFLLCVRVENNRSVLRS